MTATTKTTMPRYSAALWPRSERRRALRARRALTGARLFPAGVGDEADLIRALEGVGHAAEGRARAPGGQFGHRSSRPCGRPPQPQAPARRVVVGVGVPAGLERSVRRGARGGRLLGGRLVERSGSSREERQHGQRAGQGASGEREPERACSRAEAAARRWSVERSPRRAQRGRSGGDTASACREPVGDIPQSRPPAPTYRARAALTVCDERASARRSPHGGSSTRPRPDMSIGTDTDRRLPHRQAALASAERSAATKRSGSTSAPRTTLCPYTPTR